MERRAQTLLELIIAIGVILISTVSAATLIVTTIVSGRVSQTRVEAANLAREGIEVVRGMRDSNWMKRDQNIPGPDGEVTYSWDTKLADGGYLAKLSQISGWSLLVSTEGDSRNTISIAKETSGAHEYMTQNCSGASVTCTPTKFQRFITVAKQTDDFFNVDDSEYLLVASKVSWTDRGGPKNFIATERLYDWK